MRGGLQGPGDPPSEQAVDESVSAQGTHVEEEPCTVVHHIVRQPGECFTVNNTHITRADGEVQQRCLSTCTGEVLLTLGLTIVIGSVLWVLISRIVRRFGVLPKEEAKTSLKVGRDLPAIPVDSGQARVRQFVTQFPPYECAEVRTVGTQTKLEFPYTVSGSPKESDGYVKEERDELYRLYDEIQDLVRSVQKEDVVAGLRQAMAQLFSHDGERPDSGFEDSASRSELCTPDPGGERILETNGTEEGDGRLPVYYNDLDRTLTSAATMADVANGESTGLTPDKNEEENGSTEILNDVEADALREDTDNSIYLDMEGTAGDADIDGGNLGGRGSSGRVRRTEVERLGGEVLPNTLRSRGGRRN